MNRITVSFEDVHIVSSIVNKTGIFPDALLKLHARDG